MLRKYSLVAVLLAILSSSLGSDFYECPDDSKAEVLVAHVDKDVPFSIFGPVTLTIRVPESGLLDDPITCVIANDLNTSGGGGTVVQTGGGLNAKFVQLKITSQILQGLKYRVDVYTAKKGNSTEV
ncbi:uncharacterized protein [Leptinotarsa decemlineata]|uniref:uncharacterized protein n=1 Tax=Leptinotarsa decemlineata TaxID=7539 RepID=UPI000C2520EE|nr:uncharacterized protein LOC111507205 [Leptinotarsa decemlineata]